MLLFGVICSLETAAVHLPLNLESIINTDGWYVYCPEKPPHDGAVVGSAGQALNGCNAVIVGESGIADLGVEDGQALARAEILEKGELCLKVLL